jgi:hypothetical protein
MYRHSIVIETAAFEKLARLAGTVAAQRLKLPYYPSVHFFKEDPAGKFARPQRVAGFTDYHCSPCDLCIFVRPQSASEVVKTVFHETKHIADFLKADGEPIDSRQLETNAELFSVIEAPAGDYDYVVRRLKDQFVLPTQAELEQMEHSKKARELLGEAAVNRRERQREQQEYLMTHYQEIKDAREETERRQRQRFIDKYQEQRDRCRYV